MTYALSSRGEEARQRSRVPPAPAPPPPEAELLALAGRMGNQALQRMLAQRGRPVRPMLSRAAADDAPKVAKVMLGAEDDRAIAEALELLTLAEKIPFYRPVLALALTGNVLNPEGLKTAVSELHAKVRDLEDKSGPAGMAHEILFALKLAQSGKKVQLGGWRPDHLQKGMKEMAGTVEELPAYLEKLAKEDVPLNVGWGGDTVVWDADKEGKSLSITTIQHKVVTSGEEPSFRRELINAAQQLAGERQERALPGSRRVASILLTNEAHPLQEASQEAIAGDIAKALSHGHGKQALNQFVDRVEVTTRTSFFEFAVKGKEVSLVEQRVSKEVGDLERETPPRVKEGKKQPQDQGPPSAAVKEQKLYDEALKARASFVKAQPDPAGAAIRKAVEFVTSQKEASGKRDAWKQTLEEFEHNDADAALQLEAMLFVRCGWIHYDEKDEKAGKRDPGYLAKLETMQDRLKKRTEEINSKRKLEGEQKWALQDPQQARVIAAGEKLEAAGKLLEERRALPTHKADWEKLDDLRDKRLAEVALKLGNLAKKDEGTAKGLEKAWNADNEDKAKDIATLEQKLNAAYWYEEGDSPAIKDAIARIVRTEAVPDYLGSVASAKAALDKRARREARTERAEKEKTEHPRLNEVLTKKAKLDERAVREILATVGEIKESEGNRREVHRIVEQVTEALVAAWDADPAKVDRELLEATTKSLAKAGSGINYVGALAELRQAVRAAAVPERKGVMIGQWYALTLDTSKHANWKEADAAVRAKPQKTYATEQEVDISFYDGDTLHVQEVAANVEILRDKVLDSSKEKQRTSYLELQKRPATVTYVLDSDTDWRKIFVYGAGRGKKRTPPADAPMIKWFREHNVTLAVNGRLYDKDKLVEEAKLLQPAMLGTDEDAD